MTAARSRSRRLGVFVGRTLEGLGALVVFAAALGGGVLLHTDTAPGRRVTSTLLSAFLSDLFEGDFEVERITRLTPLGITAEGIDVYDPEGSRVLAVSRLSAYADLFEIASKVLLEDGKLTIAIPHVRIEHADVTLESDADNPIPNIARAFQITPKAEPRPPGEPTRYVRVWLPTIEIGRVNATSRLYGMPPLSGTLTSGRSSVLISPKGVAVDAARFGLALQAPAGIDARGVGSVHVRVPGPIWGSFDGHVGEVQLNTFARLDGEHLEARANVPHAEPAAVRALWPEWPLHTPVGVQLRAEGDLPTLECKLTVTTNGTTLSAVGPLSFDQELGAEFNVDVEGFDLRALVENAPETDIDAKARVSAWNVDNQLVVDVNGTTQPGTVGEHPLPAIDLTGTYDEMGFNARATLHEPGMPLKLDLWARPDGSIKLDLETRGFQLANNRRTTPFLKAKGRVAGEISAELADNWVTAELRSQVSNFEYEGLELEQARVSGRARGDIRHPERIELDLNIDGKGFELGSLDFDDAKAKVTGDVARPKISATLDDRFGQHVDVSARVATSGPLRVEDVKVGIENRETNVDVTADRVALGGERIRVEGLSLQSGEGRLAGDLAIGPDSLVLKAKGQQVDLDRVSRALGLPRGLLGGTLRIDADLEATDERQAGYAQIRIEDGSFNRLTGVDVDAQATLDDRRVTANVSVSVEELGELDATLTGQVGGRVTELESWLDATGSVQLFLKRFDLAPLVHLLPESAGIAELRGQATLQARVDREHKEQLPNFFFTGATRGLALRREREPDSAEPPLEIAGVDLQVGGGVDGEARQGTASLRLIDAQGALINVTAQLPIALDEWIEAPPVAFERQLERDFAAVISVPDRALAKLPEPIRPEGIQGTLSGRAVVNGTLLNPIVIASAEVNRLGGAASGLTAPLSAKASIRYAKEDGAFGGNLEVFRRRERLAWGSAWGIAPWERVTGAVPKDEPRWTGGAHVLLDGLPLDAFEPLDAAQISGRVEGVVSMSRQELNPQVSANLSVKELGVAGIPVGQGTVRARTDGRNVVSRLDFRQDQGRLTGTARISLDYDPDRSDVADPGTIWLDLQAEDYNAVVFAPFVKDVMPELSGNLDASMTGMLVRRPAQAETDGEDWLAEFRGQARLSDATIEVSGLGMRIEDADVSLTAARVGKNNVVRVDEFVGSVGDEEQNLSGTAELHFDNLELIRGEATLYAGYGPDGERRDSVPFVVARTKLADIRGRAEASFERKPDHMAAVVELSPLNAEIPRSSERSLISVDDNPDIVVAQPLTKPEETQGDQASLPWLITVEIGDDVEIESRMFDLRIYGTPVIELAAETDVSGSLHLARGGNVQVAGKTFVIEHGVLQFDTGDPGNPHLNVSASWRAPDGTSIIADVRGTIQDPILRWRSDPPLPGGEKEIYALLLGGGRQDGSAASGAGVIGTSLISDVLSDTSLSRIQFRVSQEEASLGRGQVARMSDQTYNSYGAAVQISENVWFEGSYKQQSFTGSQNPDAQSGFAGTIDWRLGRKWSLRTELGQLGTGLDLLWLHRY